MQLHITAPSFMAGDHKLWFVKNFAFVFYQITIENLFCSLGSTETE